MKLHMKHFCLFNKTGGVQGQINSRRIRGRFFPFYGTFFPFYAMAWSRFSLCGSPPGDLNKEKTETGRVIKLIPDEIAIVFPCHTFFLVTKKKEFHIACLGIRFDDLPGRYFEVVFILAALNHPLKGPAGTMVFRWLQQDLLRAWQTLCGNIP